MLPTNRDGLKAFLGQVPGARTNLEVGMSGLSDGVGFRVYGQAGEQWHMIEGCLARLEAPTSISTRLTGRASRASARMRRCPDAACSSTPS